MKNSNDVQQVLMCATFIFAARTSKDQTAGGVSKTWEEQKRKERMMTTGPVMDAAIEDAIELMKRAEKRLEKED